MISARMEEALNKQVAREAYASFLYLAMASWCEKEGLSGCATFFYRQSDEERMHMLKIFHYLNEMDRFAITPAVPQPPLEFGSVREVFEKTLEHEMEVTRAIYELVELARQERDHATEHFLQWYVEEQREEEGLMRTILDRIKIIGDGPQSLYFIDKEVEAISAATEEGEGGGA